MARLAVIALLVCLYQPIYCIILAPVSNFTECFVKVSDLIFNEDSAVAVVNDNIDGFTPNLRNNPAMFIDVGKPTVYTGGYVDHYILNIDSVNTLKKTINYLESTKIWTDKIYANGHFLILSLHKNISEMLEYLWDKAIFNVVILELSTADVAVFQGNPFSVLNKCGTKAVVIDSCSCKFLKSINFKRTNFNGCPLQFLTTDIYVNYEVPSLKLSLHLIKLISLKYNTTFYKYVLNKNQIFPYDFFNRLAITIFIGINVLTEQYDSSEKYYSHDLVWLVPLPRQMTSFNALLHIFQVGLWMAVISAIIITVFVWWLILSIVYQKSRLNDLSNVFLNLICITIWGNISKIPKNNALKCITITYMIYSVHIQTAYTSGLIKALTIPLYEHGIQSVSDIAASNLSIYAHDLTILKLLLKDSNSTLISNINKQFLKLTDNKKLWEISSFRNCGGLVTEQLVNHMESLSKSVRIIRNNLIVQKVDEVFKIRSGHYFLQHINYFIRTIFESGINKKLRNDIFISTYGRTQQSVVSSGAQRKRNEIHAVPANPANLLEVAIPELYHQYMPEAGIAINFLVCDSGPGPDRIFKTEDWLQHLFTSNACMVLLEDLFYLFKREAKNQIYYFVDSSYTGVFKFVLIVSPFSYFWHTLNEVIVRSIESGIIDKMEKAAKESLKSYEVRHNTDNADDKIVITLEHVCSIFVIWGVGLILAVFVFIGEHVNYFIKRRKFTLLNNRRMFGINR
ncbi:hypothetical protein RN001_004116 [Aquatica leii]|uniref:Ionotropic glutamate receptor C-terminal domain-containing protein n=1 Tax=Aquatica leii TaxID=1421715 RepID=A0AAN7PGZ6_9COLE|nr:hypothetical protein RN001_004116 [Aquatica leii]